MKESGCFISLVLRCDESRCRSQVARKSGDSHRHPKKHVIDFAFTSESQEKCRHHAIAYCTVKI